MVVWVVLQLLLVLVGVTSHAPSNSTVLCRHHERDALLAFKMGFNISSVSWGASCGSDEPAEYCYGDALVEYCYDERAKTESWSGGECCKWDGVTCNPRTGHVVELDLSCSLLNGGFPSNTILFRLPHLHYLSLTQNFLSGQVPPEIGRISKLTTLDLSYNEQLKMPDFHTIISNLTDLRVLNLSYVSIPSNLSSFNLNLSKLAYLQLWGCGMEGIIPGWIFTLPSIVELELSENRFTTIEHFEIGNGSSLTSFRAVSNLLQGEVPREIGWLSKLTFLDLSYNEQLKMPNFHTIISNLTDLTDLDLTDVSITPDLSSFNLNLSKLAYLQLWGCGLEGIIPGWIFTLPSILVLELSDNRLQGEIPNNIFELHQLQELHLDSNNLTGSIPLSRFHKLQSMKRLYLSDNRLSIIDDMVSDSTPSWPSLEYLSLSSCNLRHFPGFLREQVNLTMLELSNNGIQGMVPNWLMDMGNLEYLNLSHNSLSGGLEHLPWQSMVELDIQYNSFQGVVPVPSPRIFHFLASNNKFTGDIPHLFCNMSGLSILDLSQNNLTGKIPNCFASLISQYDFSVLNLRQNQLHGSVPSSLFQHCPSLFILDLSGNKLGGPIPQSITNCSQLNLLDLSSNDFYGTFPHYLEILSELKVLSLASNKLYGPLKGSNTTRSFQSLQILDVSDNDFTGSFPCDLLQSMNTSVMADNTRSNSYMGFSDVYHDSIMFSFKGITLRLDAIPTSLASIDASRNRLEGPIPDAIGDLTSVRWLNLTRNNFSGHIPPSLSKLTLLESLDLSFNRLEGSIPNELVNLASLEVFNVSENCLAGPVPTGKQFDTFSDSSYLGNPGLCGPLLTNKCGKPNDDPRNSTIEESEDESSGLQLWEIGLIGCGCGMLMGLAWGYLIFWVYSPYWAVRLVFRIETLVNLHQRKRRRNRRR